MKLTVQIGDTVHVYKWHDGQWKETTGVVEAIKHKNPTRRIALVNGDWYIIRNDIRNRIEVLKKANRSNKSEY